MDTKTSVLTIWFKFTNCFLFCLQWTISTIYFKITFNTF